MDPDGAMDLFTRSERLEDPARFSFIQLTPEQQSELVAERIRQRPKFDLGILGLQLFSQESQRLMKSGREHV